MVAPFCTMFIALMTFCIFGWVRISIVEAGVITSILFSSWAGADHEILCCTFLSPLSSRRRSHIVAGPSVRWALLRAGSSCNAPRSHPRRPPAAELRLAVIIIMIERRGGPRFTEHDRPLSDARDLLPAPTAPPTAPLAHSRDARRDRLVA